MKTEEKKPTTLKEENLLEKDFIKNPYPEDIFPEVEITVENFKNRRDAMFGSFGRKVFNNTVEQFQKSALNRIAIYIKEGKTTEAKALAEFVGIDLNILSSKDKDGKRQKEN